MISSVETGVQRNVFQIFCSVFQEKSVFFIKLQKLTQDGKLKICSDDPLLHANRFYAYFYGGKRVVFYIYTLYILRNCSLLCVTASRPWLSSDRFQNLYITILLTFERPGDFLGAPELRGALAVNSSVHIIYCHQSNKA